MPVKIQDASAVDRAAELVARFQHSDKVTLWSIQTGEAWENFERTGVLRGDGRRVFPSLRQAYAWMITQAKLRVTGYSGRHPVWAWYYPKPDLRGSAHLPPGTGGVRIEFSVPIGRVLLSDFESWHLPLNDSYLALDEEEDEAFDLLLPKPRVAHGRLPWQLRSRVEASWERIFDIEAMAVSGYTSGSRYIQAVLEEVRLDEVTRVTPFTAR